MVSDTAGCEIIYKEEYPKVVDCFNIGHKLAVDIEKTQAENKWISIKCTRLRGKKE